MCLRNSAFHQLLAAIALVLGSMSVAWAQVLPPVNFCGSIDDLNAFVLSWDPPANADPQLNYEIYRDNGAGFVLINVLGPFDNTTFTDFGIVPSQVISYQIRSVLNGVQSIPTGTIRNIVLTVNASVPSYAQLSWTLPYAALPPGGQWGVYRSVEGAPYEQVAQLPQNALAHNDTLWGLCDLSDVTYYVAYENETCNTASQHETDEYRDLLPPSQPVIETASVDPLSGDITVYWNDVFAPDLGFYRVQDIDLVTMQFVNVGFVPAGGPTEFVYAGAGANAVKTLAVIAFDECGNDASFGGTATTMFTDVEYTQCSLEAMVSWTPYLGWPEGVEEYFIKAYIDGFGPFDVAEAPESASFQMVPIEPNREYCFYVEAVSQGQQRNASSNWDCVVTNYPQQASFVYMAAASVLDNTRIEVTLLQDIQAVGTTYSLQRARGTGGYVNVTTLAQTTDPVITYIDDGLDPRNIQYRYRWLTTDGCGLPLDTSNIGINIVLEAFADTREVRNVLSWNAYQDWENGVSEYQIWRKLGNEADFTLYATVGGNIFVFEDYVDDFRDDQGEFCYRIVAIEANNSFGISSQSVSYADCATQPPIMWIPSAIIIDGLPDNRIFKPVAGFIDFDSFRMEIYTKWGELIFESDDIDVGWDGNYSDRVVREDYYRYIIAYRDGSGNPFVKQDVLFVLRK